MSFINIFARFCHALLSHFYNVDLSRTARVTYTNYDPDSDCKLGLTVTTVTRSETFHSENTVDVQSISD